MVLNEYIHEIPDTSLAVFDCSFEGINTDQPGSAIKCDKLWQYVYVTFSFFKSCSTSFSGTSSKRNGCSGGACFLDCDGISIDKCVFTKCESIANGKSIYGCTPINHSIHVTCISCSFGQKTTGTFVFDLGSIDLTFLNSSHENQESEAGIFHYGKYPEKSSGHYLSFIFDESDPIAIPIGLSVINETCIGELSHVLFRNCKDDDGFIVVWRGAFIISNSIFSSCSGELCRFVSNNVSITLVNCSLSSSITYDSEIETDNCIIKETSSNIEMKCSFDVIISNFCRKKLSSFINNNMLFTFLLKK